MRSVGVGFSLTDKVLKSSLKAFIMRYFKCDCIEFLISHSGVCEKVNDATVLSINLRTFSFFDAVMSASFI